MVVVHLRVAGVAGRRNRSTADDRDRRSTGDRQRARRRSSSRVAQPPTASTPSPTPSRREPGRITIGTDPSGMPRRPPPATGRRRGAPAAPGVRPAGPRAGGRNRRAATCRSPIAVGVVLAGVFVVATLWRPSAVLALITVVLGLAAVEFYDKVTEKGYRPAVVAGPRGVRRRAARRLLGRRRRAPARHRVRLHGRRGRLHRCPRRRVGPDAEHGRSRRSASSGSGCSARSPR